MLQQPQSHLLCRCKLRGRALLATTCRAFRSFPSLLESVKAADCDCANTPPVPRAMDKMPVSLVTRFRTGIANPIAHRCVRTKSGAQEILRSDVRRSYAIGITQGSNSISGPVEDAAEFLVEASDGI